MKRRNIGPAPLIKKWFDDHKGEDARRNAMFAWIAGASIDYEIVISGGFVRDAGNRQFYFADIDNARATVIFTAWDEPYALVVDEISDDLYILRQHEHEFEANDLDEDET